MEKPIYAEDVPEWRQSDNRNAENSLILEPPILFNQIEEKRLNEDWKRNDTTPERNRE